MSDLLTVKLKQDIPQNFDKYDMIGKFVIKCESFEETECECSMLPLRGETAMLNGAGMALSMGDSKPQPIPRTLQQ